MPETPPEDPAETPPAPTPRPSGVIHDIGYRHFTGERLTGRQITLALYVETLRGAFGLGRSARSKIMPFTLLALATLPTVVIAVIASVVGFSDLPIGYLDYLGASATLVVLYVAGQAPAAVSRDLRFRTVSLYFSRPLDRRDYVHAKLAALATAVAVFTVVPLLTLYAGALLAPLPPLEQTRALLVGLAAALLVSLTLSAVALVIAVLTPRRGLGVAAVIGVLVLTGGVQGALQALGTAQGNAALADYSGLLDPFALVLGLVAGLSGAGSSPGAPVPPGVAGPLVYAAGLLVWTVGSYAALSWRYARVSVS